MQNNPMQMIQAFNQFRNSFKGNAEQEVRQLVASGKMTQQQLNQLQGMATQFQQLMQMIKI